MTVAEQITHAKAWAKRLDIHDWPTIWRVGHDTNIMLGDRDIVTIPDHAQSEAEVAAVVLQYAYHNVPADTRPSEQQLHTAAHQLVAGWTDE